jgi:hypothetical protein
VFDIDITVPHTGPTATVRFTTDVNDDPTDESFGIDDFQMTVL